MSDDYITPDELAAKIGKGRGFVMAKCRGDKPQWPHVRFGKSVRFTPEQAEEIKALSTRTPAMDRAANP